MVPGDIILLSAGSLVPADSVILEERDLYANQAVLTGETFPVEKKAQPYPADASLSERGNVVFMGTNIRSGSATALVEQTGSNTVFGQVAKRLTLRPPETEFERGIRQLGYLLTEIMLVLVFGIFALNVYFHKPVLDSLLFRLRSLLGLHHSCCQPLSKLTFRRARARWQQRALLFGGCHQSKILAV